MKRTVFLTMSILVLLILSGNSTVNAASVQGFGGYISADTIYPGDEIRFGASIHNFLSSQIYLKSMNVTFVEKLGSGALRDPKSINFSRVYEGNRQIVVANSTFSDVLIEEITIETASYNVSIFFDYSNSSNSLEFVSQYALINQSISMEGTSSIVETARIIGYILLGMVVIVVGMILYNRRNRRY